MKLKLRGLRIIPLFGAIDFIHVRKQKIKEG